MVSNLRDFSARWPFPTITVHVKEKEDQRIILPHLSISQLLLEVIVAHETHASFDGISNN